MNIESFNMLPKIYVMGRAYPDGLEWEDEQIHEEKWGILRDF